MTGLLSLPFFGITSASKFAVEGLSEGLHLDLYKTGIRIKLVEPSATKTDFTGSSLTHFDQMSVPEYAAQDARVIERYTGIQFTKKFIEPEQVAKTIWDAVNDRSPRLRYRCGTDAKALWLLRRWLGTRVQMAAVKYHFGIGLW